MILRNKITGKIQEIVVMPVVDGYPNESILVNGEASLKDFNEVWEDYVPKEPLIKDDKVRKAVRAWAEANHINCRHYHENDVKFNSSEHELTWIDTSIQFNELGALEVLEDGKRYTIAELCGDEE